MAKITDTNITKWRDNFTSSDTNTPADTSLIYTEADSGTANQDLDGDNIVTKDNLGGQIRNIKAVVKEDMSDKAVEKWEFTNPTYLGRDTDTGLEKIQVDGTFDAAIFSYGTKVFFSTNFATWSTSDSANTTINNYREYGATVVKYSITEVTGKTVVYCQMPLRFIDCIGQGYQQTSSGSVSTKRPTTGFKNGFDSPAKKSITTGSLNYGNNLTTGHTGVYWTNNQLIATGEGSAPAEEGRLLLVDFINLPGYTSGDKVDDYFSPGDSLVIYKCAQGNGELGTPLTWDSTNKRWVFSTARSPAAPNFPNFDTATGHVWRIKETNYVVSEAKPKQIYLVVEKTDANGDTYTNPDLVDNWYNAPAGGSSKDYKVWYGINIDPVYVTGHFPKVTGVAVNGTDFKMYVASIKGDPTQSGQAYRRLSDSNIKLTGDGSTKEFKIYFFTGDEEKFSPGYSGYNLWIKQISALSTLTGEQDRKYDRYSINTQVTKTSPALSNITGMTDSTCLFRPLTKPNGKIITHLYDTINRNSIMFTLQFEEAIPSGVEVYLDYSLSAMDHARLTPNGDPETFSVTSGAAYYTGTFGTSWDPDNEV